MRQLWKVALNEVKNEREEMERYETSEISLYSRPALSAGNWFQDPPWKTWPVDNRGKFPRGPPYLPIRRLKYNFASFSSHMRFII